MPDPVTIPTETLLPPQWLRTQPAGRFAVYNPAVTRFRGRLLMVYRVDFGFEKPFRVAAAICQLDEHLQVVPGSVVALSDTIRCEADNHYDARFLVFGERLFVHFNNDWNTVPNQIFLVELDPDTLQARSAARILELAGPRQPCEKNWILFEYNGELLAIYQIDPHVILRLDLKDSGLIRCQPAYRSEWDTTAYSGRYGPPRGGTPPVRLGENYVSIFHSRRLPPQLMPSDLSPAAQKLNRITWWKQFKRSFWERWMPVRYYGGVYGFAATPPFAPIFINPRLVLRPECEMKRQRPTAGHMSPRRVVYPCGLVHLDHDRWLVSYGVHDERCALRVLTNRDLFGATYAETAGARQ